MIVLYLDLRSLKIIFIILKIVRLKKNDCHDCRQSCQPKRHNKAWKLFGFCSKNTIAIASFVVLFAFSFGYLLNQLLTIMELSF